jgi:hypothetical protein
MLAKIDRRTKESRLMAAARAELVRHVGGAPTSVQRTLIERATRLQLGLVKANEYSRFSALNPAERGGNSRAKTVGLQPAMVREQAV